jgi:hypothetical protein
VLGNTEYSEERKAELVALKCINTSPTLEDSDFSSNEYSE